MMFNHTSTGGLLIARSGLDGAPEGFYYIDETPFEAKDVFERETLRFNSGMFRWIARIHESPTASFLNFVLQEYPNSYVRADGKLVILAKDYLGPLRTMESAA